MVCSISLMLFSCSSIFMSRCSNTDMCNTLSTKKVSRFVSSRTIFDICSSITGDLDTSGSLSLWEASDIEATGVLSSWVMLLMKSVLISLSFCWRNMYHIVNMQIINNNMVTVKGGYNILTFGINSLFWVGKNMYR